MDAGNVLTEANANAANEEEGKVPNKTETKKVSSTFFDIIGQLEPVLRSDYNVPFTSEVYPFANVEGGVLTMSKVESLPMNFKVFFITGYTCKTWVKTDFTQVDNFSSFTEYIHSMLSLYERYCNNVMFSVRALTTFVTYNAGYCWSLQRELRLYICPYDVRSVGSALTKGRYQCS